jgi:hypothetical protein
VPPDRLLNYQKLTALERQAQLSQRKTLMRAGRERGKQKRGEN